MDKPKLISNDATTPCPFFFTTLSTNKLVDETYGMLH